jgi:hypothetical protein
MSLLFNWRTGAGRRAALLAGLLLLPPAAAVAQYVPPASAAVCGYCDAQFGTCVHTRGSAPVATGGDDNTQTDAFAALDAWTKRANQLERDLAPWRKQKNALRADIQAMEKELAGLQASIRAAREAKAATEARKQRQEQLLSSLEALVTQSQSAYNQRLLELQTALARAAARKRGEAVGAAAAPAADAGVIPPPVRLPADALFRQIDPASFITRDIYQQAVRERNRLTALQTDLEERLVKIDGWRRSQMGISGEFAEMLREEKAGVAGEVLDLLAPADSAMEALKVSREAVTRYKIAYAALKSAVASMEFAATPMSKPEKEAQLQSALASFADTSVALVEATPNKALARQLDAAAKIADFTGKMILAGKPAAHAEYARQIVSAAALFNPYATAGKAAVSLTERAFRYRQITATLDELADDRRTTELCHRRLREKIDSIKVSRGEAQRIVDLGSAAYGSREVAP